MEAEVSAEVVEVERSRLEAERDAPATDAARPMPGKTYMLLHCDGMRVRPLISTGSNGEPVATMARPSVHSYACCGVHSAFAVGFDIGITMGVWVYDIARTSSSEKRPAGWAARPNKQVGWKVLTTSSMDVPSAIVGWTHGARSEDRPRLWFGSPCVPSGLPIAPTDEHTTNRAIASSLGSPASTIPSTICWQTPSPAEPAPAQRNDISVIDVPAFRAAARIPASVTLPVPWMSSLKQRYLSRYAVRIGSAFGVSKSSNCTTTFGHRSNTACTSKRRTRQRIAPNCAENCAASTCMNSSTIWKYSSPSRRVLRIPM